MAENRIKTPGFFDSPHGRRLAYHYDKNNKNSGSDSQPVWVFCHGFTSHMDNPKALYIKEVCRQNGLDFLRFDYSGHGQSGGEFTKTCFGDWFQDFKDILEHLKLTGPISLIGASMGGFIAMKAAKELPHLIQDLILLAPAADLGSAVLWPILSDDIKAIL